MKTEITELKSWKKKIEVEVSHDEIKPHIDKAYQNYQRKIHLDGFRKGRVPLSIVKQRFGEAIQAEITENLVQEFFKKAIQDKNLPVVAPGTIQDIVFEEGQPFRFTAEVEVEPDIHVSNYIKLKFEKEILKVHDKDVEVVISNLLESRAKIELIETAAEMGQVIRGEIQALDHSGVPIVGNKWSDQEIELGKAPLGDLIANQLVGVKSGEERKFKIHGTPKESETRPQKQEEFYSIRVHSVLKKIFPELNDEFAQSVGEFQTVEALNNQIRQNLETQREQDAEQSLRNRMANEIIKRNDFELPPAMIENILQSMWEEVQKGENPQLDEKTYREQNRTLVIWNLKWGLLKKKISEIEKIEISDEFVNSEIEEAINKNPTDEKKIRAMYKDPKRKKRLQEHLQEEAFWGFIKENSKIKEVHVKNPKKIKSSLVMPGQG